jgi:hypothetical protein
VVLKKLIERLFKRPTPQPQPSEEQLRHEKEVHNLFRYDGSEDGQIDI